MKYYIEVVSPPYDPRAVAYHGIIPFTVGVVHPVLDTKPDALACSNFFFEAIGDSFDSPNLSADGRIVVPQSSSRKTQ